MKTLDMRGPWCGLVSQHLKVGEDGKFKASLNYLGSSG